MLYHALREASNLEEIKGYFNNDAQEFNVVNLVGLAFIITRFDVSNEQTFLTGYSQTLIKRIHEFDLTQLSHIAKAYDKMKVNDEILFNTISKATIKYLKQMKAQSPKGQELNMAKALGDIAQSFARTGYRDEHFFKEISTMSRRIIEYFTPESLADLLYAYSTIEIYDEPLIKAISQATQNQIRDFQHIQLASIIKYFVKIDFQDDELFKSLRTQTQRKIKDLSLTDLTIIAHAFMILNFENHKKGDILFEYLIDEINIRVAEKSENQTLEKNLSSFNRLYQVYLALKQWEDKISLNFTQQVKDLTVATSNIRKSLKPQTEQVLLDIQKCLYEMSIKYQYELDKDILLGGIILPQKGMSIQLTPEGYRAATTNKLPPYQRFHAWLTQQLGWKTIFISPADWNKQRDLHAKIMFLDQQLHLQGYFDFTG